MRASRRKLVLPLLGILKKLNSADRVIILSHLDNVSRDKLYETINHVLSKKSALPEVKKKQLKKKLWNFRADLRFLSHKSRSPKEKRRRLLQMGGGPMGYVIKTAIPLLLNLYSSK
jgi:SOS response regulatory protein OraA/RecX